MRLATRFLVSNRSLQILLGKAAGAAQKRLRSGFARFSEREAPSLRLKIRKNCGLAWRSVGIRIDSVWKTPTAHLSP